MGHINAIFIFLLSLCSLPLAAQDLSNLTLQAHYSLINSGDDATGNFGSLEMINTPFHDTCGIFSFGGYLFDTIDEDSSFVGTPQIDALLHEQFAVQVEFKVDTIEDRGRPVLVLGDGWRYLGLFTWPDGTFRLVHNDALYIPDAQVTLEVAKWHTFTVLHNRGQEASYYYIDGTQIWARADTLVQPDYDLRVTNTHGGFGWTWRGYWRNLRIYSSDVTTSTRQAWHPEEMLVMPNPSSDGTISVHLQVAAGQQHQLRVTDMMGRTVQTRDILHDAIVTLSDLPAGTLVLQALRDGRLIAQNRVLVNRD
ncbi:MAG: T9SS type A sorting domain-containing protein [Saprospiraceae bacterium]|nr:T9SS type A sorting domain-containing protein [Saprospiraceae bacterium]